MTPFSKGSWIQPWQKELLEMSPRRSAWSGSCAHMIICAQVFVRQKIIPPLVWFFFLVQFQCQPHKARNLKQVVATNIQNWTEKKLIPLGIKSYQANFTPAFLQHSANLLGSEMRVSGSEFWLCGALPLTSKLRGTIMARYRWCRGPLRKLVRTGTYTVFYQLSSLHIKIPHICINNCKSIYSAILIWLEI